MADNKKSNGTTAMTAPHELLGSLTTAFRMWAKNIRFNLDCCIPCIVKEYDRVAHKATVQPLVNKVLVDSGESFEAEELSVSVWRPLVGGFVVDAPIFVGTTGWLLASDRNSIPSKYANSMILAEDGQEDGNEGPMPPPADDEETHVLNTGFFIPDMWGNVPIRSDDNKSLVIGRVNQKGTPLGEISVDEKGDVRIRVFEESEENVNSEVANEVSVSREKVEIRTRADDSYDVVKISKGGIEYDGKIDREQQVLTDMRYDIGTHQIQKKVVVEKIRGDFIVEVGEESDWIMIDGGQAVPESES